MQEIVRKANPDVVAIPPQLFQDEAYRGVSFVQSSFIIITVIIKPIINRLCGPGAYLGGLARLRLPPSPFGGEKILVLIFDVKKIC